MNTGVHRHQNTSFLWGLLGVVLAVCMISLSGCGGQSQEPVNANEATVEDGAADGSATNASSSATFSDGSIQWDGNKLTVTLESDPSTGYSWSAQVSGDGLELAGDEQNNANDAANNDAGGTSSEQEFAFTGTGKGDQVITFTYKRPEGTSAEDKEVVISVATDDSGNILSADAAELSGVEASESSSNNDVASSEASDQSSTSPYAEDAANAGSGTDANVPVGVNGDSSVEGEQLQEEVQTLNNAQANGDSGASE